jgi:hypothetical protein
MPVKLVAAVATAGSLLVGIVTPAKANNFTASFYDMSDSKFSVQAISPRDVIREYAVCKAVWFAEKKKAQKMSLSDPVYSDSPKPPPGYPMRIPDGWIALNTTAYLTDPNPSGNPVFGIAEKAAFCRKAWYWYR